LSVGALRAISDRPYCLCSDYTIFIYTFQGKKKKIGNNIFIDKARIWCYNVIQEGSGIMPHVSLRVSEGEKIWMEGYAKLHGLNLSDAIKAVFFEKLEDEYDLKTIREYESKPDLKFYSLDDVKKELGLDGGL